MTGQPDASPRWREALTARGVISSKSQPGPGRPHEIPQAKDKIILIMFNKPKNMICSHKDKEGRPTIFHKLPPSNRNLLIASRLDYHSEGLLLLTNDGELLFRLTHPSHHVEKRYLVKFKGHLSEENIGKLRQGIELGDGCTQPIQMMKREATEVNDWFERTLEEL